MTACCIVVVRRAARVYAALTGGFPGSNHDEVAQRSPRTNAVVQPSNFWTRARRTGYICRAPCSLM